MSQLVSIIIPCHNAARWLAATLESALGQTWTPVEIIVVDDGSTDESLPIARRHADDRLRVITQANAGAAAARNAGLRAARGEFIQFLDADDLLSPGKIAAQVVLLASRPPGTIASCAWGRFTQDPASAQFVDTAVFRDFSPGDFLALAGATGAMMHPSAWLVPRGVADRAGPWDETLSLNDDGEYFSRALLASPGVAFCPDPAARSYYRSGLADSLSRQRTDRARRSQFRSVELIGQHLLAAEDSPRRRQTAANLYQRFIFDYFPAPAALMETAALRIKELGGSSLKSPAMGPRTRALAALLGWKNVWRLKYFLSK
jgi:glycosyltransferase involved in cell wall biosynthesis